MRKRKIALRKKGEAISEGEVIPQNPTQPKAELSKKNCTLVRKTGGESGGVLRRQTFSGALTRK